MAHILIIDDDEKIVQTLAKCLQTEGYTVETALTGTDAIAKCKEHYFNLSIIDIVLPDISGIDLLVLLQREDPQMRKVILTGNATLKNAMKALNRGADKYLLKPVEPQALLDLLKEQFDLQKQEKEQLEGKIKDLLFK